MECEKSAEAGEKPDAPQETLRSMGMMAAIMSHLRSGGQFLGSSGSLGAKAMILVDEVWEARRGSFSRRVEELIFYDEGNWWCCILRLELRLR